MTKALLLHGASAVILGRRADVIKAAAETLQRESGSRCLGIAGDVRSQESLKSAVEEAVRTFGRIDFVICG